MKFFHLVSSESQLTLMMTRGWPANSLAIFFMCGSSSLQGPHQVAQKSMRTTRPPMASRLNFEPSRAVTVKARGHFVE